VTGNDVVRKERLKFPISQVDGREEVGYCFQTIGALLRTMSKFSPGRKLPLLDGPVLFLVLHFLVSRFFSRLLTQH
jgi:hypothetical protein